MKGIIGDMSEICCNFTDSKIYKITPELARDGSIGGFFVKLQKYYLSDKQLVRYFWNIPTYFNLTSLQISLKSLETITDGV